MLTMGACHDLNLNSRSHGSELSILLKLSFLMPVLLVISRPLIVWVLVIFYLSNYKKHCCFFSFIMAVMHVHPTVG